MYRQFSKEKRVEFSLLLREGYSLRQAAKALGVSHSTLSRELRRNRCRSSKTTTGYHAGDAQRQTRQRRHQANQRHRKINPVLARLLDRRLSQAKWSPEQIAGWLGRYSSRPTVCHQTIYTWLRQTRPDLMIHLHCRKGKYRRTRANRWRQLARVQAAAVRHISQRPARIERRRTAGDWEGDTIVGARHGGYIATFTERKTGFLRARLLPNRLWQRWLQAGGCGRPGRPAGQIQAEFNP